MKVTEPSASDLQSNDQMIRFGFDGVPIDDVVAIAKEPLEEGLPVAHLLVKLEAGDLRKLSENGGRFWLVLVGQLVPVTFALYELEPKPSPYLNSTEDIPPNGQP